jgi:hypothetical protein
MKRRKVRPVDGGGDMTDERAAVGRYGGTSSTAASVVTFFEKVQAAQK